MLTVSLYARVSSEKQVQENTIASQLSALENKIKADGYELLDEHKFVDNGYSGSNLVRPALEKLRNKVAEGKIDIIYIHSPDRLSRKYAYQMVLLEELQKAKVEVIFLNNQINDSPEAHLLLQMQGMIAEYEHTKITERCRRGKIYAAKKGSVNVMCRAPYGYRYINKQMEGGQARFEVYEEEAEVVRKLFSWIGRERMSAGEVCRQLNTMSIMSAKGKCWNKGTLCGTLKNPVYKGQAAFGKTKVGAKLPQIRPYKHSCEQPKKNSSTYRVGREHWIYIPVPKIVDEDLFDIVQKQLAENAKRQRARQIGTTNLLQGLLVCKRCQYSYYAKRYGKSQKKCYRCIGADAYRFAGNKICNSKTIRASTLETAVWEEVKSLLKNPNRILKEYQRRLSELQKSPCDQITDSLKKQDDKLKQGISRLIDSYTQGYISKEEFEPRIKAAKQSLKIVEEEKKKIFNRKNLQQELTLVVTNLEEFFSNIKSKLDDLDWLTKRNVIRILVKRIEVDIEEVNIVFRVKDIPHSTEHNNQKGQNLQHCRSSQLHSYGLLQGSFRPDNQICVLRSYARQRDNLIKSAAAHIQRMQKALIQMNIQLHKVISDITGVTGIQIIKAILEGERNPEKLAELRDGRIKNDKSTIAKALAGDYREEHLFTLKQEFELYNIYQEKIAECDRSIEGYYKTFETKSGGNKLCNKIKRKSTKHRPNFAIHEELHRITGRDFTKVPGLDVVTIQTIISETGINPNRWRTEKHFSSWLGLSPANKITGEKVFSTRTRKVINRAANAFRIAAHCVSRSNSGIGAYCRRIKRRLGAPKAITATARKLACIFYSMLKYGQEYVEKGMNYYETRYKERVKKNLIKKAQEFGYILVQKDELVEGVS